MSGSDRIRISISDIKRSRESNQTQPAASRSVGQSMKRTSTAPAFLILPQSQQQPPQAGKGGGGGEHSPEGAEDLFPTA